MAVEGFDYWAPDPEFDTEGFGTVHIVPPAGPVDLTPAQTRQLAADLTGLAERAAGGSGLGRAGDGMSAPTLRKHTRFQTCGRHHWLNRERRQRRAEFFTEGGPTDGPCEGGRCRMWAGTDLFQPWRCVGEYPLSWGVNKPATWADGYGTWHARVSKDAVDPKHDAMHAIRIELEARQGEHVAPECWKNVERVPTLDTPGTVVYREGSP